MASPRTLRSAAVGALLLAALGGCRETPDDSVNEAGIANNIVEQLPTPEPLLDRRGLLLALGDAATAFAIGADDTDAQQALAGKRFAFRMAFGCPNGDEEKGPLKLMARPDGKSYEARARFTISSAEAADFLPDVDNPDETELPASNIIETVEGFWVERPWMLAESCPVTPPAAVPTEVDAAPPPPDHVAGIAQFLTPTDSRVAIRGGRDYVKVVPLKEGETVPPGLLLLVEGRLRAWPDGKTIECRANVNGGRPVCLIGVRIDRVAFERIDDRSVVAEWTNS